MKSWPIAIVLLLSLVLVGSLSCAPANAEEQENSEQPAEQDDLTVIVSGSGNIEVSNELKLTFSVAGKVDKIYVEEGDEVSEGEVLATLETDALELALNKEQVALNQAQAAGNQAQVAVTQAQAAVTQAQASVTQAEIALQTAEYELEQTEETYTLSDIKAAQSDVDAARRDWEEAIWTLYKYDQGTSGWEEHQKIANQAQLRLNAAEDKLDAILFGTDTREVAIKKLRVEATQQSLEAARQSFELARQSVELAQKQLDEATITAPFDGLAASISVDEGDTVSTAITIVHLIDPNSMELNIEVDEIDIPRVKLGQRAIIEIDALPDLALEGKLSSISPLPTIETGLIMYDVKIEFDVPEDIVLRTGMSATADIVIAE